MCDLTGKKEKKNGINRCVTSLKLIKEQISKDVTQIRPQKQEFLKKNIYICIFI